MTWRNMPPSSNSSGSLYPLRRGDRMRQLVFLSVILLAGVGSVLARTGKVHHLAVLAASPHGLEFVRAVTLVELEKLGYTQGQNLVVDMRAGPPSELPGLVRALVALSPS